MRANITVAELLPIRTFTGKNGEVSVYAFKGSDNLKYETFDKQLAPTITSSVGNVLDLEWEDTTSADGKFTNHKIKMIYVNGNPAVAPKESKGFGGGYHGSRSAETETSIMKQSSLKSAVDFCIGLHTSKTETYLEDVLTVADAFYQWVSGGQVAKPTPQKPPQAVQSTPAPVKAVTPVIVPPANPVIPKVNALTLEALNQLAKDKDTFDRIKLEVKTKGWTTGKDKFTLKDLTQPQADIIIKQFSTQITEDNIPFN